MKQLTGINKLVSEVYRYLMVFAACMVCLAHGSNDVANAISPLVVFWVMQPLKLFGLIILAELV
jgi:phosphate/sulfate permease